MIDTTTGDLPAPSDETAVVELLQEFAALDVDPVFIAPAVVVVLAWYLLKRKRKPPPPKE